MTWYTGKIREPLLEGETVTVCGQEFVIAPSNIARMRKTAAARRVLRDVFEHKIAADSDEGISALTEIAAISLSANYPDMTPRMLDEQEGLKPFDLLNVHLALRKVNGDTLAGEAAAPQGGATTNPKTGTA